MSAEVFDSETAAQTQIEVVVDDETEMRNLPLTLSDIKEVAANYGVRKYHLYKDGVALGTSDFPVRSGESVEIREYNDAKAL
jgi:hypothetical protein